MSRLIRLYPGSWRERYGDELAALLEARPPTIGDRLDLVRGAMDAHAHARGLASGRSPADRWWLVPLVGWGLLAIAIALAAGGPVRFDDYGSYRDGSAAMVPFVAANWLLIAGLGRLLVRLPADAGTARVAGSIAIVSGTLWSISPWSPVLGVAFFGAFLVAIAFAWRARFVRGWLALSLGACLAPALASSGAMLVLPWYVGRENPALLLLLAPAGFLWPFMSLTQMPRHSPGAVP